MAELTPCPFCGSHGEEVAACVEDRDAPTGCEGWFVRCYVCHVETVRDQSREDAVATWNRRASPPAAAVQVLSDEQIERLATKARLDDEMWFGPSTPNGYKDCLPMLRQFAQAVLAAGSPVQVQAGGEGGAPLPHWEPCNPGCDPEFNGHRSRYCARLCQNARDALAATPSPITEGPVCSHGIHGVQASDEDQRAATRREVLSDVDPVVLEAWRLQGRKAGAMLREAQAAVIELQEALRDITDDYADRFDLNSPSTNPGIKSVIRQARAVLRTDGVPK